jgi:methyltransferase
MVSRLLFTALCGLVAVQRLREVRTSRRNELRLLARGAREHAAGQFAAMRALHAAWIVGSGVEVWLLRRRFSARVALPMLGVFAAGQLLRRSARLALGERWTVRVITLPGCPPVTSGPYRYVRHPNYLGVACEIAALPLMHGAWLSALGFSLANALLLTARVRAEEAALDESGLYARQFAATPRFVPARR